ncbi:hypothetical protein [Streptomyces jeddahensis]|uniref:Uncharacterized protein n=1 Tax=Streptomyces jeddahensis TaxID=1716141 RepID=A0A177HW60_9ACTN|nr:hypothetical protein [Streptomyces jeddahensis]OAH15141.1 hypothetical protein STSP_15200 [Streptomyces jeddahensis]
MPRPTAAQLAYGSATVVLCTLAMLLVSQTSSGLVVAVIALAALGLGLLVALTMPQPKTVRTTSPATEPALRASAPASGSEERVVVPRVAAHASAERVHQP